MPVAEVDTALIVKVLEPLWTTITETATRVRGRIEKILGYAITAGYRKGDNPARWKGRIFQRIAEQYEKTFRQETCFRLSRSSTRGVR
jgi:hypothetical protein